MMRYPKKYRDGGYASVYGAGNIPTGSVAQLVQDYVTKKETKDVMAKESAATKEEFEEEAAKATKKSKKYADIGGVLGTAFGFVPGWGKFAKAGIEGLSAMKQKDIFKDLAKLGKTKAGTFMESFGEDFTKGYEDLAKGFSPLKDALSSIATSYTMEGVEKGIDKIGPETVGEELLTKDIPLDDAGNPLYTAKDIKRISQYEADEWALPEKSSDWTTEQLELDKIDPEALDAYREAAKTFEPGALTTDAKPYGDMTFQERLKDYFKLDFEKGDYGGNLKELFSQGIEKMPLLQQLTAKPEEVDLTELMRSHQFE